MKSSVMMWGVLVSLLAGFAIYDTILNSYYQFGASLHDSGIFATIMWHNGWLLNVGPSLGSLSVYVNHMTPIHYIPNFFSYFYPGDRISYYGFVYALVYGATIWRGYRLMVPLFDNRFAAPLAAFAMFLFFCSQAVFQPAWEPRMEALSPLFAMIAFEAWQHRQYRKALFWLLMNAAVREDFGAIYAVPTALLAGAQWLELRRGNSALAREKFRWGVKICSISIAWTVIAFAIQKMFFPGFDLFHSMYFDQDHPLGHLTGPLLMDRAHILLTQRVGIWLPLLVMAIAAVMYRDLPLATGAVAFLPYVFINYISKDTLSATMDSYKLFPFALSMLWPALMAIPRPNLRQRYLIIQILVLVCGLASMSEGRRAEAAKRWPLQPYAYNEMFYHSLGAQLEMSVKPDDPSVRASRSVLTLYPYQFASWWQSGVDDIKDEDIKKITLLIWFEGDRDQETIDKILKENHFNNVATVLGTKIHIAKK